MKKILSLIFVFVGVWSLSIRAAEYTRGACKGDIEKFCQGILPSGIIPCLRSHEAQLSDGCKENGQAVKQKIEDFQKACGGDAQRLCGNIKPGSGNILKCLKQNESSLSPDCKTAMTPQGT